MKKEDQEERNQRIFKEYFLGLFFSTVASEFLINRISSTASVATNNKSRNLKGKRWSRVKPKTRVGLHANF